MEYPRTVFINNFRGAATTYAVCFGPPNFSVPGGSLKGFMTVWRSYRIPFKNYTPFMAGANIAYYAWTGATRQHVPVGPGVRPVMGMELEAKLGASDAPGSSFNMQLIQNFPVLVETAPPRGAPGAFEVWTGYDFTVPNDRFLVGIAEYNQRNQIAPVAFVAPYNNTRIQVQPKLKFWITESDEEIGVIVDYDPDSPYGAVVDFDSADASGKYIAEVTQRANGLFDVIYT